MKSSTDLFQMVKLITSLIKKQWTIIKSECLPSLQFMHPIILVLASCTYIHLLLTICRTRSSQRRQLDTDWPSYLCLCYNLYLSKMESITFNITALVKCTVYYKSLLRYKTYLISFNGQCYNTVVLRIVLPNTSGKYLLMIWWEILWIVSLKPS